jgi:L-alanine-DL-glutamate epimerase-like enolase superfamily enzyme
MAAAVRENIGYDMPLSMDHLGHIGVKSVMKLSKAYEKFNLEWIEDVIPWYYTPTGLHQGSGYSRPGGDAER